MGLTRGEFFARIGMLQEIDPITSNAYYFSELLEERAQDKGDAAEDPWHVSFHGSQFPGDSEKACGRAALYRMIDAPRDRFSRKSRQLMEQGKDFEERLTAKWHRAGMLLTPPPYDAFGNRVWQQQFEDAPHWLTSTVDGIVLYPRATEAAIAEVKHIGAEAMDKMKRLVELPGAHDKYVNQVKTQIALAHEHGPWEVKRCYNTGRLAIDATWFDRKADGLMWCAQHGTDDCLEDVVIPAVKHGFIYYASRDDPLQVREFYFDYDPAFMEQGRKMLKLWQDHFKNDLLPCVNFDDKRYSHPFGWKWGDLPCKWCDYGQICREDRKLEKERGAHVKLSESAAIAEAREIRPDYEFDLVQAAVMQRWPEDEKAKAA